MKILHSLLLAVGLMGATAVLHAQTATFKMPADRSLATAADCKAHNADFLRATGYLLTAPQDAPGRKDVNAYAITWLTNTADVSMSINADITKDWMDTGDMLVLYMAGWGRYVLQTKDTSLLKGNVAGMHAMLTYYAVPAHKVPQSKALDRLAMLDKEGKLEDEVAKELKNAK